jgi:hypothetical protein
VSRSVLYIITFVFSLSPLLAESLYAQNGCEIQISDPTLTSPRQYEIREVTVEGVQSTRESFLISTSGLSSGTTITIPGEEIPDAIRRIHRTGLFSDVEICHEPSNGGVDIRIILQEEPSLQAYDLEGIRRSHRRDLRERLTLYGLEGSDSGAAVVVVAGPDRRQYLRTRLARSGLERERISRRYPVPERPYNVDVTPDGTRLATATEGTIYGRRIEFRPRDARLDTTGNRNAYLAACEDAFAAVGSMAAFEQGAAPVVSECGLPDLRTAAVHPHMMELEQVWPTNMQSPNLLGVAEFHLTDQGSQPAGVKSCEVV